MYFHTCNIRIFVEMILNTDISFEHYVSLVPTYAQHHINRVQGDSRKLDNDFDSAQLLGSFYTSGFLKMMSYSQNVILV
jgi:hypothetical protein